MKACRVCNRSDVKFEAQRAVCYSCRGKQRRGTIESDFHIDTSDFDTAISVSDFERTVVLFDVHVPDHNLAFWKVVLLWLADLQPERIVLGGDFADLESASTHGGNPKPPALVEDVAKVREALVSLRRACPDAKIIFCAGNHETRLARLVTEVAPTLHGALNLHEMLGLDNLGITWVPEEKQPIRIGSVKILHGHQMRGGGKYPANRLVEMYGESGVTVMCGHFHRTQTVTKLMAPHPSTGMVIGCGRTLDPKWLGGPSGWEARLAVIDDVPGARAKVTSINVDDGALVWGNRVYRAS